MSGSKPASFVPLPPLTLRAAAVLFCALISAASIVQKVERMSCRGVSCHRAAAVDAARRRDLCNIKSAAQTQILSQSPQIHVEKMLGKHQQNLLTSDGSEPETPESQCLSAPTNVSMSANELTAR